MIATRSRRTLFFASGRFPIALDLRAGCSMNRRVRSAVVVLLKVRTIYHNDTTVTTPDGDASKRVFDHFLPSRCPKTPPFIYTRKCKSARENTPFGKEPCVTSPALSDNQSLLSFCLKTISLENLRGSRAQVRGKVAKCCLKTRTSSDSPQMDANARKWEKVRRSALWNSFIRVYLRPFPAHTSRCGS